MEHYNERLFFDLTNWALLGRVAVRLAVAMILGGVVGLEREWHGKSAGLRTYMLVSMGSALIVIVSAEGGMGARDMSRVIQGLVTGIGFLGGGTILKLSEQHQVRGLTSAASIWLTAAAGMSVGLGLLWPAIFAVLLGWIVLELLHGLEVWLGGPGVPPPPGGAEPHDHIP